MEEAEIFQVDCLVYIGLYAVIYAGIVFNIFEKIYWANRRVLTYIISNALLLRTPYILVSSPKTQEVFFHSALTSIQKHR